MAGSDLWERRGEILVGSCLQGLWMGLPLSVTLVTPGMCDLPLGALVSKKNSNKHEGKGPWEKENILNHLEWDGPRQQRSMEESLKYTLTQSWGNVLCSSWVPYSPGPYFPKCSSPRVLGEVKSKGFSISTANRGPVWGLWAEGASDPTYVQIMLTPEHLSYFPKTLTLAQGHLKDRRFRGSTCSACHKTMTFLLGRNDPDQEGLLFGIPQTSQGSCSLRAFMVVSLLREIFPDYLHGCSLTSFVPLLKTYRFRKVFSTVKTNQTEILHPILPATLLPCPALVFSMDFGTAWPRSLTLLVTSHMRLETRGVELASDLPCVPSTSRSAWKVVQVFWNSKLAYKSINQGTNK